MLEIQPGEARVTYQRASKAGPAVLQEAGQGQLLGGHPQLQDSREAQLCSTKHNPGEPWVRVHYALPDLCILGLEGPFFGQDHSP